MNHKALLHLHQNKNPSGATPQTFLEAQQKSLHSSFQRSRATIIDDTSHYEHSTTKLQACCYRLLGFASDKQEGNRCPGTLSTTAITAIFKEQLRLIGLDQKVKDTSVLQRYQTQRNATQRRRCEEEIQARAGVIERKGSHPGSSGVPKEPCLHQKE